MYEINLLFSNHRAFEQLLGFNVTTHVWLTTDWGDNKVCVRMTVRMKVSHFSSTLTSSIGKYFRIKTKSDTPAFLIREEVETTNDSRFFRTHVGLYIFILWTTTSDIVWRMDCESTLLIIPSWICRQRKREKKIKVVYVVLFSSTISR